MRTTSLTGRIGPSQHWYIIEEKNLTFGKPSPHTFELKISEHMNPVTRGSLGHCLGFIIGYHHGRKHYYSNRLMVYDADANLITLDESQSHRIQQMHITKQYFNSNTESAANRAKREAREQKARERSKNEH